MSDKVFAELDPVFETVGLLYTSYNFDKVKQNTKNALSNFGIDGEQFYSQHLKAFDQYVQEFLKNKVASPEDEFFFVEEDFNYIFILLSLIIENKSWFTSEKDLNNQSIHRQIIHICQTVFDEIELESPKSLEDSILFLEKCELDGNAKWKLLQIMQHPQKYINMLISAINSNMESYHKAVSRINKPLSKLQGQYQTYVCNGDDKTFLEVKNKLVQSANIYPTLAFPVSQMIFEKNCYYGLLSEMVIKNWNTRLHPKESLLIKLKALSDNSKLEIISSLKISPKYNLEIAQQLGLTPATMSHHMSVLLNCGFVGIEKKDGKVYYHLIEENMKSLLEDLKQTLL